VSHALEVANLVVTFDTRRAVDDVTLHVDYGEVVALLGPNGAGKTTLVETALGFRAPTSGLVRVHGLDPVRDHAGVVARTGALLQRGGVWFPMTPAQVLDLTATYYAQPRDPRELLDLLALGDCATTPWRRLSGGQQQRTLLALALLGRPRVLMLDEPTAAVDPEGRQVIRELIAAEAARGCALLLTTHELTEAERVANRLVVLHHGHVVAAGSLAELSGEPRLVVEVTGEVDVVAMGRSLGLTVTRHGDELYLVATSSPALVAAVTSYLASVGVATTSLRTRASLEETYLALVAESEVPA
jgi:ABC-2 type transport system ATP-binding protein